MLPSLHDWLMKGRWMREAFLLAPCVGCALFIFGMAFVFLYTFADAWGWMFVAVGLLYCWMVYEGWRNPGDY